MAEPARVRFTNAGFTLIEVLASLLIFSCVIGLSSNLVASGVSHRFISQPVEPWLNFMENSAQVINALPNGSPLLSGDHQNPVSVPLPPDNLDTWNIEWHTSNLRGVNYAVFTASTREKRLIKWRFYRCNQSQ